MVESNQKRLETVLVNAIALAACFQAGMHKTVTMEQSSEKLDAFLSFNEHDLLTHAGKVKADMAIPPKII